jgi:N-acetylglucosaminyl-diphospho-decaprenol L-rhamnosyltransferase
MDVSIIIVNWNSKDFLGPCLESIRRHTRDLAYEVIVIDSGSFDGCGEMLAADFPSVRFIQSPANLGFAGANNAARRLARASRLLFLNPDTELVSPAVNHMVAHLDRSPDAGAIGCRLLNRDGSIQACCVQAFPTILGQLLSSELLLRRFPHWPIWGMPTLLEAREEPSRVQVVSGACLMVRSSAFDRVGGFSEDYFMYAEDLDVCHKLRQAGLVNYYLPWATVRHFGGGSTDKAPSEFSVVMMRDSIWRFLRKSRGIAYGTAYRMTTTVSALARLALLLPLYPLHLAWKQAPSPQPATRKWLAILAWSTGVRRAPRPA